MHFQEFTHPSFIDVEVWLGDAEEGVRVGDAEEGDVVVLEDVSGMHVLLVLAAEVVQLVVLKGEYHSDDYLFLGNYTKWVHNTTIFN